MIITCEQCQARFRLADDKLKAGGTKVRCSKCRHIFAVFPPEEAAPEESADFDADDPATDDTPGEAPFPAESQPEPQTDPLTTTEPSTTATGSGMDLDFSGLEESMGPGTGDSELAEEFSFAGSSTPAPEPDEETSAGYEVTETDVSPPLDEDRGLPGEFDFDNAFAETESPAESDAVADEPAGFTFNEPSSGDDETGDDETGDEDSGDEDSGAFNFDSAGIGEEFSLEGNQAEGEERAPDPEPDDGAFAFGDDSAEADSTDAFSFSAGEAAEKSPFDAETPFGDDSAASWGTPDAGGGSSFDFNEPSFETSAEDRQPERSSDGNMGFGEIDFSSEDKGGGGAAAPSFGAEPDFEQATLARPAEPEAPSTQSAATPPPRQAPRPRSEEPLPIPKRPGKNPASRVMLGLVLLLLVISGAAGYFYYMGNGRQLVEKLLLKAKGEEPAVQVAPNIAVSIDSSAYVDNRATGQLLVIQGSVTNNSPGGHSAITVKGTLLDAAGKDLQQQTVFCGNYLSDEKLRTMKYAQIEEAMNNQFGDSLVNMNVKPGGTLQYTIVFRNVPKEMANITVDYADSKPGDGG